MKRCSFLIAAMFLLISGENAFAQGMVQGGLVAWFLAGGICMWPLLACALAGIAVVFERMVVLSRIPSTVKAEKQLEDIENALSEEGLEGCAKKVSKGKGILNYTFARLLRRYDTLIFEQWRFLHSILQLFCLVHVTYDLQIIQWV